MKQYDKTTLQLRWLRLKRHLRSLDTSPRALRDSYRALSGEPLPRRRRLCGARGGLCGRITRLAA